MTEFKDHILRLQNAEPGSIQNKLRIRGDALWDIGCNLHEVFQHEKVYGTFEVCTNANCLGVKGILQATEIIPDTYKRR